MRFINRKLGLCLLSSALAAPIALTGCSEHHYYRTYDPYYSDYHTWNRNEDLAYRRWLAERRYEYREYPRQDRDRQRDYWTWRHSHPDNDRDRHDHDRDHDRH